MQNEDGVTLFEILFGMLVLTILVTAMMRALDQSVKGQSRVRNDFRAATLAKSKLDSLKDYVHEKAYSNTFYAVTSSPQVVLYAITQTANVENKLFSWNVRTSFTNLSNPGTPVAVTYPTQTVTLMASVRWNEGPFARYLTQTAFVSDNNQ